MALPAPGMLAQHYSPRTPLTLHARIDEKALGGIEASAAVLLLRRPSWAERFSPRVRWLSEEGELSEMARNLFARLRALDGENWTHLHAEIPSGDEGLAPAIRDRLTRAAAKR